MSLGGRIRNANLERDELVGQIAALKALRHPKDMLR
jgi:hypothetical protein